jgi:hypothetical protein
MRAQVMKLVPLGVVALMLSFGSRSARAADTPPPPAAPGPTPNAQQQEAPHGRVSFTEGDLFVRGPFDSEEQNLTLNSIIREGDIVRAADNTLGEVELPNETFLRVSANSVARIDRLEAPIEVSVIEGSAYLSNGRSGEATLNTKMGSAGLSPSAMARIEATRVDQTMSVRVAKGNLEAMCREEGVKLGRGDSLTCGPGISQRGQWDVSKGDAFDRWNAEREEKVRHYSDAPPDVAGRYEGLYDLEGNGHWVYVDNGWYWQPTVVATDWRPYYDGYWGWYPTWGWTWMPYTHWGYVTHHYGRWLWRGGYGWMWSPAPVFGGAWVVWGTFGGYVGWAPCDFWGRPAIAWSRYSYYDHGVWSFGHPRYFYEGGGNYLHRGYAQHHQDVVGAVSAAGHERPFFTMNRDQIAAVRASPVRDANIALAPRTAAERSMIGQASNRQAILHNMQPAATRPGPLLSRLAEQENTHTLSAQGPERGPSIASHVAGANVPGASAPSHVAAANASQMGAHESQPFTRPSFSRQTQSPSTQERISQFNRWSSTRASSQVEHESGFTPGASAGHNETPISRGTGNSGFHPSTPTQSTGSWGHSYSSPSFGGSRSPGGSMGGSQGTYHPPTTYSHPSGPSVSRPSGGGWHGGGGHGGGGRHR